MLKGNSVELLVLLLTNIWVSVKKKKNAQFSSFVKVYRVEDTWDPELFSDKYELRHIIPWWPQLYGLVLKKPASFLHLAIIEFLNTCFNLLDETTGCVSITTHGRFQLDLWRKVPEHPNEQLKALLKEERGFLQWCLWDSELSNSKFSLLFCAINRFISALTTATVITRHKKKSKTIPLCHPGYFNRTMCEQLNTAVKTAGV